MFTYNTLLIRTDIPRHYGYWISGLGSRCVYADGFETGIHFFNITMGFRFTY